MQKVDQDFEDVVRSAVREAAAEVAFEWGRVASGQAIYAESSKITDRVTRRITQFYTHTRKAVTRRKVGDSW